MSLLALFVLLVIALFSSSSHAANGIDISGATCNSLSYSDFQCLAGQNSFIIIQAWDGGYQLTSNLANCVNWAWQAGFAHVDLYVFACPNCNGNSASNIFGTLKNYVNSNDVKFGQVWLDIEQCSGCWNDVGSNCNYVGQLLSASEGQGFNTGFYSSEYEWSSTVGSCSSFTGHPLWYAMYDGQANFNDGGYRFGGWGNPAMKQYSGTGNQCGVSVDLDWYPS